MGILVTVLVLILNMCPPRTLFWSLTVSVDRPWHSFHTVQKLPWHMTP